MTLEYRAIPDVDAEQFLDHYIEQRGTFGSWAMTADAGARKGWGGSYKALEVVKSGNRWRYAGPPKITSVYPGVSSVSIALIAVLVD